MDPQLLSGQDSIDAARQALVQRMLTAQTQGYGAAYPQLAMQGQPNAQASVQAPSAATPTQMPRDQAQAAGAVQALQGGAVPGPVDASAVPQQQMQDPGLPGPQQTLDAMRQQFHQNIQNDPRQGMAIYDQLSQRGFSPEQVRQILGAGPASPDLLQALQAQGTINVPQVHQLPFVPMQQALQEQEAAYQKGGVRALSPQQGAGLDPWPTNMRDAAVDYNDPNALLMRGQMRGGEINPKDLKDPQLDALLNAYGSASKSTDAQFISKQANPLGLAIQGKTFLLGQIAQGVDPGTLQKNWAAYGASNPHVAAASAAFGVGPGSTLAMRGASTPAWMANGMPPNGLMSNMNPGNTPPMDVSGAGQAPPDQGIAGPPPADQGGPPLLPDGTSALAPPDAAMGRGGAPANGPQPRVTNDAGSLLATQLDRLPISVQAKAAIKGHLANGEDPAAILAANPSLGPMLKTAAAASKSKKK